MKIYYISKIFGELQSAGSIEILKYHQISGGWHVVIKDTRDDQDYEMTIIPVKKDAVPEVKNYKQNWALN